MLAFFHLPVLAFSTLVSGPGFEDVLNTLYGGPAKKIVNYLDVSR